MRLLDGGDQLLREAMGYKVRGLSTIVRDNALIRLAHVRGRQLLNLGGTSYLATG